MNNVIELQGLQKHFDSQAVLKGVELHLRAHSVLGLLGVNGAGKTTLIRCALGMLKPSAGQAEVFGHNAWDLPVELKQRIGFVPQVNEHFEWMSAQQMLKYIASFYPRWDQVFAEHLLAKWELLPNKRISKMSEGQKQRLAIILALGHQPDLLVLDEPVAALDPIARRDFIAQLIELNIDEGKSILFSTHIVSDLERLAADVAIMRDGLIYHQGEIDTLKEKVVKLHIRSDNDLPAQLPLEHVLSSRIQGNTAVACINQYDPANLQAMRGLLNADVQVQHLGLEDIFLEVNQR